MKHKIRPRKNFHYSEPWQTTIRNKQSKAKIQPTIPTKYWVLNSVAYKQLVHLLHKQLGLKQFVLHFDPFQIQAAVIFVYALTLGSAVASGAKKESFIRIFFSFIGETCFFIF